MPAETRLAAASAFLTMWVAMMGAMMIPSLVPTLARDRPTVASPSFAGASYFAVWAVAGAGVYVVGTALVTAELHWPALAPAIPNVRGAGLVVAGWGQLPPWQDRTL